jgi:hypothetical protein
MPDNRAPSRFTDRFRIVIVIIATVTVWFDELDCI